MKFTTTLLCAAGVALSGCSQADTAGESEAQGDKQVEAPEGLAPGSNEMLRARLAAAPDLEVLISDVIIPPGAEVPRHYHPGEEFVYVIEGSAVHVEEGKPDRESRAGDAMVIEPEAVHAPRAGPDGTRAIVFRVHLKDQPERIPVPDAPDADDS